MTTIDQIKAIIGDKAGVPAADIADDANLGGHRTPLTNGTQHLALDSLDKLELIIEFSEAFSIDIPDADADKIEMGTPEGIAAYIDRRLIGDAPANIMSGVGERYFDTSPGPAWKEGDTTAIETVPDYAVMSAGDMLAAVGVDGMKWAIAFSQIMGGSRLNAMARDRTEVEDMLGWFANAIMAGFDHGHGAQGGAITRSECVLRGVEFGDEDEQFALAIISALGWPDHRNPLGLNPTHKLVPIAAPDSQVLGSRFRKLPVTIEAVQFDRIENGSPHFRLHDLPQWVADALAGPEGDVGSAWVQEGIVGEIRLSGLSIGTLEGNHFANPGDWIIRGLAGEIYPCKPDIFAASYEPVGTVNGEPFPA